MDWGSLHGCCALTDFLLQCSHCVGLGTHLIAQHFELTGVFDLLVAPNLRLDSRIIAEAGVIDLTVIT